MLEEDICENAAAEIDKAETYTKGIFKMYGGEKEIITLKFTKEVMNAVFDHFGEKIKINPVDEDVYQVEVEAQISPTFWGWFFQFVGEMEIISPASLVKEYKNRLSIGNKITSKKQ